MNVRNSASVLKITFGTIGILYYSVSVDIMSLNDYIDI
jgi:hypothetical protein